MSGNNFNPIMFFIIPFFACCTILLWLKYLSVVFVVYTETNNKKVLKYMILTLISGAITVKLLIR